MLRVLDCNEFWSPSGGGVRRYHLEKIERFRARDDIHYVFAMPDAATRTETLNGTTAIEHVRGFKFPGNWEYRMVLNPFALRRLFVKHRPDIIEIGSPYLMPWLVRLALAGLDFRPRLVGFWHADFPVTYIGRFFVRFGRLPGKTAETLAWAYARGVYNRMDAVFVASRFILDRMVRRGLKNLHYVPLGVDTDTFHPDNRDAAWMETLRDGRPDRLILFFGHRFCEEKGLRTFLEAYPRLCRLLGQEPAVVFAGTGPDRDRVEAAVKAHPRLRNLGYVGQPHEMARLYASCDIGLMLSGWETFGLAVLEAMASGTLVIGADQGGTREHVEASRAGLTFRVGDPESLAQAIARLHRIEDGEDRRRSGRAYAEGLTWDACFRREKDLYASLADGGPAA